MRVTKLIREYVTKSVNAVYEKKIKAVWGNYKEEEKKIEEALIQMQDEFAIKLEEWAQLNGYRFAHHTTWSGKTDDVMLRCTVMPSDDTAIKAEANALREERDAKINDILLTLELGGNKADLDRMIAELI